MTPERCDSLSAFARHSPKQRASATERRYERRTDPVSPRDSVLLLSAEHAPIERWLWEVEDACFKTGREFESRRRKYRRIHWRVWDLAQRMAWRYAPDSRVRYLLEPEEEENEIGYRGKWKNRYPERYSWDFFLRFLWLFARDSRLRRLIAPDDE